MNRTPKSFTSLIKLALALSLLGWMAFACGVTIPIFSHRVVSAAAGFCIVGGQTGANALVAYRHPTYIRATALAWALGAGRIASIVGPLLAGLIISLGWSSRSTFFLAVIPALCASGTVLLLGERVWRSRAHQG